MLLEATTKAGRLWRTGRSEEGNGTLMMSQVSKVSIGPPIRIRVPFVEVGKGIIHRLGRSTGQYHFVADNCISDHVTLLEVQRGSYWLWDCRLRFAGQFA